MTALLTFFKAAGVGPRAAKRCTSALVNDHDVASEAKLAQLLQLGALEDVLTAVGMGDVDMTLVLKKLSTS